MPRIRPGLTTSTAGASSGGPRLAIRGEFQESTWQAFWRTAVEGQSPKQVAEDLGLTVGAVYVYRNRIVARLRKVVEQADG